MRNYGMASNSNPRIKTGSGNPSSSAVHGGVSPGVLSNFGQAGGSDTTMGNWNRSDNFAALPLDILYLIFLECDVHTLLACRLVCRHFETFINSQKPLLYRLALLFEKQLDEPSLSISPFVKTGAPLTSHQKLERLRKQALAWRGDIPPAIRTNIPVSGGDSIYELNGGVFALGDVHATGNGLAGTQRCPHLNFVRLPSAISGQAEEEWGRIKIPEGIGLVDFTMNVDEDLLILIEQKPHDLQDAIPLAPFRLHFYSLSRSISSLEPHPLAYRPIVEYPGDEDWWEYQVVFGMYGDHICLLLGSGQPAPCSYDRLVVWDWKQGGIAERRAEEEIFESFVLLEEGIILLPDVTNGRINLLLYRLSKPENDNPGGPNYQPGLFHILMIFKLPGLQVGLEWAYIQMRSQPSGQPRQGFGHIPRCSINSGKESVHRGTSNSDPTAEQSEPNPFSPFPAPFTSSIDDSIIVISTRVTPMEMGGGAQEQSLRDADGTLVVKRSLFRKWMKEAKPWAQTATIRYGAWTRYEVSLLSALSGDPTPEESSVHQPSEAPNLPLNRRPLEFMSASFPRYCTMPPPKMVQWNEWMYETRWLRGVGSPRWVRDVHGTRVVSRVMERTPLPPAPSLMDPYSTSPDQSTILNFLNSAASLYPMSSEDSSTMISAIGALSNDSSNPVVSTSSSLSTVTVSPGSSAPNASNDPPIPSHVQAPLGSPSSTSNQAQSLALSLIPTFASMAAAINSTSTQSISSGLATPMNSAVGMQATTHQTEQAQSTNDLTSPVSTPSVSSSQSTTPLAIPLPSLASLFTEIAIPLVLQNLPTAPTTPQPPLPANAAVFGPAVERSSHRTRIYDFNNAPYCRVPRSIPYPDCIKLDTSTSTSKTASDSSRSQICASQRKHEEKSRRRDNGWSIISPDDDGVWTRRPVWEETFIPPGTTYAEEICTRMPYLEITSTELNDCSALMIDTERIIQMKTDENGNLRCLEVFVM